MLNTNASAGVKVQILIKNFYFSPLPHLKKGNTKYFNKNSEITIKFTYISFKKCIIQHSL